MKIGREGRKKGVHRKPERTCCWCKKVFNSWHERTFCSMDCRNKSYAGKKVIQDISGEERQRRKDRMTGEANPMWCGGDSDRERRNSRYKVWRIEVFTRDDFTCQCCGYRNGNGTKRKDLNAHHIVKWIDSIELRYEVDNGKTLCVSCHIKEHTDKH